MKERPILFSAPMVVAIIHGLKGQTRRVVTPQPKGNYVTFMPISTEIVGLTKHGGDVDKRGWVTCPYGIPGDRLWVRETFCLEGSDEYTVEESQAPKDGRPIQRDDDSSMWCVPWYRATDGEPNIVPDDLEDSSDDRTRWKPSIFMPRWASRITLEITKVRVQRLNDIDNVDAMAEGVRCDCPDTLERTCAKGSEQHFKELWNKINAKRGLGWDVNPWVWAIDFKRINP